MCIPLRINNLPAACYIIRVSINIVHVYCILYQNFIASFAVFLDINCFTLIACLNFLLLEFSQCKKSTQLKTLIVAATTISLLLDTNSAVAAASTKNTNIFFPFRGSPTSKSNVNGKELFRPDYLSSLYFSEPVSSSLSKSSTVVSSSNFLENLLTKQAPKRNSKRKQTRSNSPTLNHSKNSNDILLIYSNEYKNSSSPFSSLFPSSSSSTFHPLAPSSSLNKQKDTDTGKNKHRSNSASDAETYNYAQTKEVTKFQGKVHSVSEVVVPLGKFTAPQFTFERQQNEKTGATATVLLDSDSLPVSYLTNSNYELSGMNAGESNHDMEKGSGLLGRTRNRVQQARGKSASVQSAADVDAEEYPNSPNIEYLAMPLQSGNNDEILLDFTTLSPLMTETSTMFVESSQDFESPSPTLDNDINTNDTVDIDDKAILYNLTAGKVHYMNICKCKVCMKIMIKPMYKL